MKLFKLFRKKFARLGITSHQSKQSFRINRKILIALLSYGTNNTLNYAFIFNGGHSFVEYTDIVCMSATTTMIAINYTILLFKMEKYFEFIASCDKIATERE